MLIHSQRNNFIITLSVYVEFDLTSLIIIIIIIIMIIIIIKIIK